MHEYTSEPVPAITRAVKVDALNSCSAYRFRDVCMARTQEAAGARPCSSAGNARRWNHRRSAPRCAARCSKVMPVAQHRSQGGEQAVRDVPRAGDGMPGRLRQQATEGRDPGAQHVHWMAGGRQLLEHVEHRGGRRAQGFQLRLVGRQLGDVGSVSCTSRWAISSNSQRVRYRECRSRGNADRSRSCRRCTARCCPRSPRQRDRLLGLEPRRLNLRHCLSPSLVMSIAHGGHLAFPSANSRSSRSSYAW